MDNAPPAETKDSSTQAPSPEVLKPKVVADSATDTGPVNPTPSNNDKTKRHRTYRPSHKATFISLAVVIVILVANALIIAFILKGQSKSNSQATKGQIVISSAALDKVGVNSTTIGSSGIQLTISPYTVFKNDVSIAGKANLSGQLTLNSKLTGTDATLTQLEAGNTALGQLSVNGNTTLSTLNLRSTLVVAGTTQLQGPVTLNQLLTLNGSLNVAKNVAIGGVLSVNTFSANSLTSTSTLTIGGHIISGGSAPSVGPGGVALGSNGTVSVSGNDSAGVININIGTGAGTGTLAHLAFHTQYGSAPRVVITPVGVGGNFYVLNVSTSGFSVAISGSGLSPGGYAIYYIVEQ